MGLEVVSVVVMLMITGIQTWWWEHFDPIKLLSTGIVLIIY